MVISAVVSGFFGAGVARAALYFSWGKITKDARGRKMHCSGGRRCGPGFTEKSTKAGYFFLLIRKLYRLRSQ